MSEPNCSPQIEKSLALAVARLSQRNGFDVIINQNGGAAQVRQDESKGLRSLCLSQDRSRMELCISEHARPRAWFFKLNQVHIALDGFDYRVQIPGQHLLGEAEREAFRGMERHMRRQR